MAEFLPTEAVELVGAQDDFDFGWEADRVGRDAAGLPPIRWWLFARALNARPQGPRKGVVDRGFRFARGGRAATEAAATAAIQAAVAEGVRELEVWKRQPSHALGPGGALLPLDEVREPAPARARVCNTHGPYIDLACPSCKHEALRGIGPLAQENP